MCRNQAEAFATLLRMDKETDIYILKYLEGIVKEKATAGKSVILVGMYLEVVYRSILARTLGKKYFQRTVSLFCLEKSFSKIEKMIFSVLACMALILSICIKNRKVSLKVQSINCLFETIYAFYIHAFTGAILGIFNFIRSSLFVQKEKFSKKTYFYFLIIFECSIIINCAFTWNGYISFLLYFFR